MLKVLDLFSGIGGFSLGLERTGGFKTEQFVEIDFPCLKVLHKNFPDVDKCTDIRNIAFAAPGLYDVVCGGFPCQDISVAGLKKGITNETRSGLWYEFKRIIKEVKPRWVIIENVRNLLNNGLAIVLKDLHEIGYNAEWEIISARSVGAPHLRERIWIVAYTQGSRIGDEGRELHNKGRSSGGSGEKSIQQKNREAQNLESRTSSIKSTNTHNFRFWKSFATEEEKQKWWSEATSSKRDWWETESGFCRILDGLPKGLDKGRRERIKQLGNSIVPQIVEIIGERILEIENGI